MNAIEAAAKAIGEALIKVGQSGEVITRQWTSASMFKERELKAQATAAIAAFLRNCEVSDDVWSGLPRDLIAWMDMEPTTPRMLFKHLELSGCDIPQWLRDEPEMQLLDRVPSKGTRAVIVFKAMAMQIADELESK